MNDLTHNSVADGDQDDGWLGAFWEKIRRRWWLVLAFVLAGCVAAIYYLQTAQYTYTAELRVSPAESLSGRGQGGGGLSNLAQLAGLGSESAPPSAFRLYLEGLKSREVADRLARDPVLMRGIFAGEWDQDRRSWRRPPGGLKASVWSLLGLPQPTWQPPDGARLQLFLAGNVAALQNTKSPLVTLALETPNPKFGMRFLTRLDLVTDAYLREKQQQRSRSNITYLSDKLRGVTFAEQRAALFAALNDEERAAMLANSRAPFAAEAFGVATASLSPTKPRQLPVLLGGPIIGLVFGVAIAALLGTRRRREMVAADLEP